MVALGALAAGFLAGRWLGPDRLPTAPAAPPRPAAAPAAPEARETPGPPPAPATPPIAAEPAPAEPAPPPGHGARLALIVDDLGRRPADVDRLAALGVPLAGAVLPFEPRTVEVAAALAVRGLEVLCHLPMEPEEPAATDPGPGALTLDRGRRRLLAATRAALDAVPGAAGANHHMGSALTADPEAMRSVLAELGRRGLYYVDSRTVPESVGYARAVEMGVPAAERDVFLDADPAAEAIRGEWRRLLALALEKGAAVAIAHPREATLAVLGEEIPRARAAGYEFVPVADLLTRAGGPGF